MGSRRPIMNAGETRQRPPGSLRPRAGMAILPLVGNRRIKILDARLQPAGVAGGEIAGVPYPVTPAVC